MFKVIAALAFVSALAVGANAGNSAPGPVRATQLVPVATPFLVPATQLRAEGKLLGAPKAGVDLRVAKMVEPGIMSIVFTNKVAALEFYNEAVGNGEAVCLSDLGPQQPQFHGQRYWLRSC
jgi:hypothetical protein